MTHNLLQHIAIIFVALAAFLPAKARIYTPQAAAAPPPRVSLLTAAPGSEVYQLEGHSGLRLQFDGRDEVANWGVFDFRTPHFIYRFLKGETDYIVALWPYSLFMSEYIAEGRTVIEQELDLTPDECRRLIDAVLTAAEPQNRVYRYNYVLDNCATRPVAFIERAVADSLRFPEPSVNLDRQSTFRNVMRHFHRNYPWYQFGIDMALGPGIDRLITIRETGFAPVVLQEIAAGATIGDKRPLVKSTTVLNAGRPEGAVLPPTPWYLTPMTAMCLVAALCAAAAYVAARRRRLCRAFHALYYGLFGTVGCLVAFLLFVSSHEATSPNWIILWINPLCLMVPALVYVRRATRLLRLCAVANLALIALYAIVALCSSLSPNPAFWPLALSDIFMSISYLQLTRDND